MLGFAPPSAAAFRSGRGVGCALRSKRSPLNSGSLVSSRAPGMIMGGKVARARRDGGARLRAHYCWGKCLLICIKLGRMFTAAAGGSTENGALTPLGRMEKPEALPIDRGMRGNYNTHAMYIVQYILPYLHLYGKERLKWHPETNLRGMKW